MRGSENSPALPSTSTLQMITEKKNPRFEIQEVPTTYSCQNVDSLIARAADLLTALLRNKLREKPFSPVTLGLSADPTAQLIYTAVRNLSRSEDDLAIDFRKNDTPSQHLSKRRETGVPNGSENSSAIDWNRVKIFLVDEIYAPVTDPRSGQRAIRESFLGQKNGDPKAAAMLPIPEKNLIFPDTTLSIEHCVQKYQQDLIDLLFGGMQVNVVTLCVGADGHVASILPTLPENTLSQLLDPKTVALHVQRTLGAISEDRISTSLSLLQSAEQKVFLLNGREQVDMWGEVIQNHENGSPLQQPVTKLLRSGSVFVICTPQLEPGEGLLHKTTFPNDMHLTISVFGASGDLARKKTYPALFSLYCQGLLPRHFHIVGFARSAWTFAQFWEKIMPLLRELGSYFCKRICETAQVCNVDWIEKFKSHCLYLQGEYGSGASCRALDKLICELETDFRIVGRMLYLALPPVVFGSATRTYRNTCWTGKGWNRVIIEKPFGRDLESSTELSKSILSVLQENEIYRIDHYLGKEMALNVLALKFANIILCPLFHRCWVHCVRITFKEDIGTSGRGSYFDQYGIIRDVMQNHLLQLLTLIAMERPASMHDEDIREEKVKVLKQIPPIILSETVIGQYVASEDGKTPGYREEPMVTKDSLTPTFCTMVMWINSERWNGVPFVLKAGKGLETKVTEIRIQFRRIPSDTIFFQRSSPLQPNELVILVQPSAAIYVKLYIKSPGFHYDLRQTELDLTVMDRCGIDRIPDAYERLLLDVIQGDKQNFVRTDELAESWRIFTPLLHQLETRKIQPLSYPFGSRGPLEAYDMIRKHYMILQQT